MRITQLSTQQFRTPPSEESLRLGSIYGGHRSETYLPNPALRHKQLLQPTLASGTATVTTFEEIASSKKKPLILRGKKSRNQKQQSPGAADRVPSLAQQQSHQSSRQADRQTPIPERCSSASSGGSTPGNGVNGVVDAITIPGPPPLPRFHSRQCVPSTRNDLIAQCSLADGRSHCLADRHIVDVPKSRPSAMALKFLSGHGGSNASTAVKYFDIRLDNDYIVFRGGEDEAASAQLAGSLVLCLTEPLQISHVQLTLSGIVHMSWQATSASSMSGRKNTYKEITFFEKTWPFKVSGKSKTETLPADNYEWPFDTILEGALPESIEGMKDAWIIYRLKAEIGRKRAKDIIVRKPLRIVRTLDPSALELAHAMSVENIWPNKIEYSISVPSKAIVFGSFVRVDFKLVPLLKGLQIGTISTQVKEEQEFVVDPEWGTNALGGGQSKVDRLIANDTYTIDAEKDMQILDEAAEGYQFTRFVELPKTLNKCLQDCNVKGIKVRHKVKFNVQLLNPDGHISELRANLPISLYISPSLPINDNNDLVDQSPQASRAAVENDLANSAPPLYGEHQLDKLYSEINPSGYLTPGFLSTPGTPYLHSRHQSQENLRSLDAITNGSSGISTPNGGYVSPIALQNRLANLDVNGHGPSHLSEDLDINVHPASADMSRKNSQPRSNNEDYFAPHDPSSQPQLSPNEPNNGLTQASSSSISRRVSEDDDIYPASGARTPFAQYAHMEDLSRVPSYSTAVKTSAPRQGRNASVDLPTYGAAMTGSLPREPVLMAPPTAHVRSGSRSREGSVGGGEDVMAGMARPPNRNVRSIADDERRLRILQARGR